MTELYASIGFLAIGGLWLRYAPSRQDFWSWVELLGRANLAADSARREVRRVAKEKGGEVV